MNEVLKFFPLFGLMLIHGIGTASAATLVSYDFASGVQSPALSDPNVATGDFTAGTGLAGANYSQEHARAGTGVVVGSSATPGTDATSFSGQDYFTFTIGPASGYVLNLEKINFDTSYYAVSATTDASYFLRSSIDGFAANIGSIMTQAMQTSAVFSAQEVNLIDSAFQGISGSVEFRIYLYDTNSATTRWVAIDNVVLSGAVVAIPEPGGVMMFFLSAIAGFARLRRR